MKYIILFCLLFSGCALSYDFDNPCVGMDEEETANWIEKNIQYEFDFIEYWKSPRETLKSMSGDCEDFVILFMYLMYHNHGVKYDMGVVIVDGYFHAVAISPNNRVINIQGDSVFKMDDIIIRNGYNLVMAMATTGGLKNAK